jgi:hypothetical protein
MKLESLNDCVTECEVTGTAPRDTDVTSSKLAITLRDADTVSVCDTEPVKHERDKETKGERSDAVTTFVAAEIE